MSGRGFAKRRSERWPFAVRRTHLLALVAVAMACGACLGSRPAPSGPSQASLAAEPEASLQSPASTQLQSGGYEGRATLDGPLASVTWRRYGTQSSWAEVVSYFDEELGSLGWATGGGSSGIVMSHDEVHLTAWNKGDRILRLSHRRFVPNVTVGFPTYYEVTLIGRGLQCCASPTP
jgi:hypothetical protein